MNKLEIIEYRTEDKPSCLSIFGSNVPQYFMPQERAEFIEWLDKPDRATYYVLLLYNEVIACGGIYKDDEQGVAGLAWGMVDADLHRKGHGRHLTTFRLEQMYRLYPDLEYHLQTSQHTAVFYEKLGFETIEVIKDGFGTGMDNHKMVINHKKY